MEKNKLRKVTIRIPEDLYNVLQGRKDVLGVTIQKQIELSIRSYLELRRAE